MIYDFHTHTSLSDGALSPMELIGRAVNKKYKSIALTDHTGPGTLEKIIAAGRADCALAISRWKITAIAGVELTYVPPEAIDGEARKAKEAGAQLVIVHGETIVEPVPKGTNLAALESAYVDILAHPGLMTPGEAKLAAANGKFIEISARKGHSLTNGHLARLSALAGFRLLLNSDTHDENDLLDADLAAAIARGAGIVQNKLNEILVKNPKILLDKLAIPEP